MQFFRPASLIPVFIAAVGGVALGWFWRGQARPSVASQATAHMAPDPSKAIRPATAPAKIADTTDILARIRQALRAKTSEDDGWRTETRNLVAGLDFEQLKALIPQLKKLPREDREFMLMEVALRMGQLDPRAALAFGDTLRDDHEWPGVFRTSGSFRGMIVQEWAAHDPADALTWIMTLPLGEERSNFLGITAISLAGSDPASAARVLESLPQSLRGVTTAEGSIHGYIYRQWARQDPLAASAAALAFPPGPLQQDMLKGVAKSWAEKDPAAALAWTESLPPSPARSDALNSVAFAWAKIDPKSALEWTLQTEMISHRSNSRIIFNGWSIGAPEEAWTWLSAQPAGQTRDTFMGNFISTLATTDRAKALELFKTELAPNAQRLPAISIAVDWAATEPAAAAAWAAQIADAGVRAQALGKVVATWAGNDHTSTAAWLQSVPAGAERDGLVAEFVNRVATFDPKQAVEWASTLSDSKQRVGSLVQYVSHWRTVDPDAAQAWIENTNLLPSDQKTRLLTPEK